MVGRRSTVSGRSRPTSALRDGATSWLFGTVLRTSVDEKVLPGNKVGGSTSSRLTTTRKLHSRGRVSMHAARSSNCWTMRSRSCPCLRRAVRLGAARCRTGTQKAERTPRPIDDDGSHRSSVSDKSIAAAQVGASTITFSSSISVRCGTPQRSSSKERTSMLFCSAPPSTRGAASSYETIMPS